MSVNFLKNNNKKIAGIEFWHQHIAGMNLDLTELSVSSYILSFLLVTI